MSTESCLDKVTHKPRLLSEQCSTCVGRPGNLMHLRPGRLRKLINDNIQQGAQGLVCHQTLSYGGHPEFGDAFCRWFYDTYGHLSNYLRIVERLGGFTEVAPPKDELVFCCHR